MVAWRVPPEIGKQIAIKGGEKPKGMHVTLAFIPDMEAATTAGLEDCLRIIGARTPVLEGSISGIGRWAASALPSEGLDVIYAAVDVPGLAALRTEVVECLGNFAEISETHDFTPHITLAYVEPAAASPVMRIEPIAIEVDHLVLAANGGTIAAYPLSGDRSLIKFANEVGEKQDEFAGPFDDEHRRDTAKLEEVVLKGLEAVYKNVRRRLREEVKATAAILSNTLEGVTWKHRMLDDLPHDEGHLDELGRPYLPADGNSAFPVGSHDATLSEKALQDVPFDEQFWAQQKPVFFKEVPTDLLQEILGDAVYFQPQALGLIGNFDLVNEEVLRFVNGYTDAWWGQLTKTTRNTLRNAIEANISNGEPLSTLVKSIQPLFGKDRARIVSVTEVTRLWSEGNRLAYRAAGIETVEFRSVLDSRVDERCSSLHGERWLIGQEPVIPPVHPNCLPGDALVAAGSRISAASERWYDGDMVVIRTASGKQLTCTPNHPILTNRGWIASSGLNVGGHVISGLGQDGMLPARMHDEDMPTPIHQVAEAFRRSRSVLAVPVPTTAPDFHGDGAGSKVAVIYSDGLLGRNFDATVDEHVRELALIAGDVTLGIPFARLSPFDSLVPSPASAFAGDMGSSDLLGPTIGRHLGPLQRLGIAAPAYQAASLLQSEGEGKPTDSEAIRYSLQGLAGLVGADHMLDIDGQSFVDTLRPNRQPQLAQPDGDSFAFGDSKAARDLLAGLAGLVSSDDIVHIERVPFSGHVYNLQTDDGWYVADGIITHNCRCWLSPVTSSGRALTKPARPIDG